MTTELKTTERGQGGNSLVPPAPVLGPRPPGVPTSPLPPPPGSFSSEGGGVGEGQRRKPGGGDGGGDEGTASCLLESPGVLCSSRPGLGPGALCWPEPWAPAAAGARCGGREGAAQLCAGSALSGLQGPPWQCGLSVALLVRSCPEVCGVLVPRRRMKPASPTLQGGFPASGPPGTFKIVK